MKYEDLPDSIFRFSLLRIKDILGYQIYFIYCIYRLNLVTNYFVQCHSDNPGTFLFSSVATKLVMHEYN
jgi:hypothetical protein